jgi:hypothetical protein
MDLDEREASLDVSHLKVRDFFDLNNALANGRSTGATVSFHVRWKGGGSPITIGDGKNLTATVIEDTATIRWTGRNDDGFHFQSTATTLQEFSEIGRERNGVFL